MIGYHCIIVYHPIILPHHSIITLHLLSITPSPLPHVAQKVRQLLPQHRRVDCHAALLPRDRLGNRLLRLTPPPREPRSRSRSPTRAGPRCASAAACCTLGVSR